jgi:Flp pilus assembly pilin Flp
VNENQPATTRQIIGLGGKMTHFDSGSKSNKNRTLEGQSLTEYLILVALIGVASIGIVQTLGSNIQNRLAVISDRIIGKRNQSVGRKAKGEDINLKDLNDFQMTGRSSDNE